MKKIIWISLLWALIPMLPALWQGGLAGSPYTDLYFSVWSLYIPWIDDGAPCTSSWLNYPYGQPIYSSAYLKSILSWLLSPLFSPAQTYNLLLFCSRIAGPICAFMAIRAWGYTETAAIGFSVIMGMSPYVHGYAVEGIIEGIDVWPLALWLWACSTKRIIYMASSLALCLFMSWYLGASACLLTLILARKDVRILHSLWGILIASPAIWTFVQTHPTMGAIPIDVRESMSAQLGIPTPNILSKGNPFAKNNYVGWCTVIMLLQWKTARWALIPLALSFGIGSELPLLSSVRFPYRWHLATMVLIGFAVADVLQKKNWSWFPWILLLEFLLLSNINFFIPTAPSIPPNIYNHLDRPVLDIPGPISLPAGVANPSRERAFYLLYAQLYHKQPSLWPQDFNSLQPIEDRWKNWQSWDPILKQNPVAITFSDQTILKNNQAAVLIHHKKLRKNKGLELQKQLQKLGFSVRASTENHTLLTP